MAEGRPQAKDPVPDKVIYDNSSPPHLYRSKRNFGELVLRLR